MLAAALPDWLDADRLEVVLLVALALVVVVGLWLMWLVQKLVLRFVIFAAIFAFGVTLWAQRAELGDCATSCNCKLFGQDVVLADDRLQQLCEANRQRRQEQPTA